MQLENKRIIVTGGASGIGSHFINGQIVPVNGGRVMLHG